MKVTTQSQGYDNRINIFVIEPGEHYGKCLGSTTNRSLANKVRDKLKADKITMLEAIEMLRGNF
jgi:hypothetical protein